MTRHCMFVLSITFLTLYHWCMQVSLCFQIRGLCGKYDNKVDGDLETRSGIPEHPANFMDSYVEGSTTSRVPLSADPCGAEFGVSQLFIVY